MKVRKPPLRIWSTLGAALILLIAIASLSLAFNLGSTKATPSTTPPGLEPDEVVVTNEQTEPVPVTGSVDASQTGIWRVGVSNLPAVQLDQAANTVKIDPEANTVEVDSSDTEPIYVTAAASKEPYTRSLKTYFSQSDWTTVDVCTTPIDKWWVIETVSLWGSIEPGEKILSSYFTFHTRSDEAVYMSLVPTIYNDQFNTIGGYDYSHFSVNATPMRIYQRPNTTVSYHLSRDGTGVIGFVYTELSGYLTDQP